MFSAVSSDSTFPTCDGIPENSHSDLAQTFSAALDCCDEIVNHQIPNLLRLYPNPFVAGCCLGISELVKWGFPQASGAPYSSFLTNSGDEALSGAIKLARFYRSATASPTQSPDSDLLIDDSEENPGFVSIQRLKSDTDESETIVFLPGIRALAASEAIDTLNEPVDPSGYWRIVAFSYRTLRAQGEHYLEQLKAQIQSQSLILIVTVDSESIRQLHDDQSTLCPDIVVFDQSFTRRQIPFGAIAARPALLGMWQTKKMSMFHSTTFQPNTVSTKWFLECLRLDFADVYGKIESDIERFRHDVNACLEQIGSLYSPTLRRTILRTGFQREPVTTDGHFIRIGKQQIYDGVAGVACSIRGHNPPNWATEIRHAPRGRILRSLVGSKLAELTGLPHFVPAVSGASAVEQALRLALSIQECGPGIIVLKRGFAGKTMLALTGTTSERYKIGIEPLYQHTTIIDPTMDDSVDQFESVIRKQQTSVVLLELIQGVGGVRAIPENLLTTVLQLRDQFGYRVIVDEVQTGVYRTGPFIRSSLLNSPPDFVTIGKAASDMMIPFSATLYSDSVQQRLNAIHSPLPDQFRNRSDHELAYRTLWNILYSQNPERLRGDVEAAGMLIETTLRQRLNGVLHPSAIRVFGLLCGFELPLPKHKRLRLLRQGDHVLRILHMLQDPKFPLLMGYCQYEPNVLKFTPPLSITESEIQASCDTIVSAIEASFLKLMSLGVRAYFGRK
ncbi:MAG: aminotransferase class III-fold pyridoxal phosphate-dependent enzyme [Planctomyces sp.]|nr:aminotransferase class III-fold pyridoxal phosphate-dependent enzyme [Planctomyces sp.]